MFLHCGKMTSVTDASGRGNRLFSSGSSGGSRTRTRTRGKNQGEAGERRFSLAASSSPIVPKHSPKGIPGTSQLCQQSIRSYNNEIQTDVIFQRGTCGSAGWKQNWRKAFPSPGVGSQAAFQAPEHLPHPFNILVDTFFAQPPPARCVKLFLYLYFVLYIQHNVLTSFHCPPFLRDTLYWANLSWKLEEEGLVFEGKSV